MKRLAICLTLYGIVTLAASEGFCQPEATEFDVEGYAELVHIYLQGGYFRARRELSKVRVEHVLAAVDDYMTRWLIAPQIKAAAMLHTEVAMSADGTDPAFHYQAAQKWIQRITESRRRRFERRWYLVVAYHQQKEQRLWEARPVMEAALQAFPEDVEIRLAFGTLMETVGSRQGDSHLLRETGKHYRIILEIEPDNSEAHVRLGRVLALLAQDERAVKELERGIEATETPKIRLAGLLTLGDIHRDRGELSEANRFYRQAVEIDPDCQSAAIALAHNIHKSGDQTGSFEVMERFLTARENKHDSRHADEANQPDLWRSYLLGNSDQFESLFRELRSEI